MGDVWIDELAAPDDGAEIRNGPADVFERVRSGVPDELDRRARREDQEREQRRAEAREKQRDYLDAARLRGEPIMTVSESLQARSAVWFAAQDRADRERDRGFLALGEQLHVERKRIAKLEHDLAEKSANLTRQLAETSAAHRSRHEAQENLRRVRYGSSHRR
jgi:hypothetical protein